MSFLLRAARPADAPALLEIYAPFVRDTAVSFEAQVPSVKEMEQRIAKAQTQWAFIVAQEQGTLLGYAYATQLRERAAYRFSCETSVYLASQAQGRGIASALYRQLIDELQKLGYCNAFAAIALPNTASVKLHETIGFAPCGVFPRAGWKFGQWHDIGWWHKALLLQPIQPD
jgi:L-amino acid N-acyltransferase YncA